MPRVVGAYVITGLAAINIADVAQNVLDLPDWTTRLVAALLAAGLPVAVALAWAFDITPEGVVRTPAEENQGPRLVTRRQHRRKIVTTAAMTVAVVALGGLTVSRFLGADEPLRPDEPVAVIAGVSQDSGGRHALSQVVSTLLGTRLGSFGWRTVDTRTSRGVLQLPGEPAQLARLIGAPTYVDVRLETSGENATVRADLYRIDDPQNALRTAEAEGTLREVVQLVHLVAARLAGLDQAGEGLVPINRIAALPAEIEGPEEYEYLAEGVPILLAPKLEMGGWPASDSRAFMGVVRRHGGAVPSDVAATAAGLVDAEFLVRTRVEVAEEGLDGRRTRWIGNAPQVRLWIDLHHVGDMVNPIRGFELEGDVAELPQLVDEAASLLLEVGNVAGPAPPSLARAPTGSLPALEAFVEGERQFREGRFRQAGAAYEEAVRHDPEFALAYYRLGVAADWSSDISDYSHWKRVAIDLAIANEARMTWRHRLLAEARRTYMEGSYVEAEQLYKWILESFPNDYEGNFQLAEILFHQAPLDGRSLLGSEGNWQEVLTFEPSDFGALMHFARLLSLSGRLVELEAVAARALELSPNDERVLELDAIRAFAAGNEALIRRTLAALEEAPSDRTIWRVATSVALYTRDLEGAERIAALLTEATRPTSIQVLGHVTLAHLRLARGQWRAAQEEIQAATSLDPLSGTVHNVGLAMAPFVPRRDRHLLEGMRARLLDLPAPSPTEAPVTEVTVHDSVSTHLRLYALGLLSLELGSENDANYYAAELERLGSSGDAATLGKALGLSLRTESYRVKGLYSAAARQSQSFGLVTAADKVRLSPFFALTRERFVRALLLKDSGQPDEALRWFSSFGEVSLYDLAYLAPAHFYRAQLLESKSEYGSATEDYRRVVELWNDPDPEMVWMVDFAQERLRLLTALDD